MQAAGVFVLSACAGIAHIHRVKVRRAKSFPVALTAVYLAAMLLLGLGGALALTSRGLFTDDNQQCQPVGPYGLGC